MTEDLLHPLPDIRHLRLQEIPIANAVINTAFQRYLGLIGLSVDDMPNPYDYLPDAVADNRAWAALVEEQLVGVALVDATSGTHWQIDLVGVLETHANAGIGRAMMQRIETEARASGDPVVPEHAGHRALALDLLPKPRLSDHPPRTAQARA
jgi:GNAT superfamily N-acetyltransferase